jgi:transaldolase
MANALERLRESTTLVSDTAEYSVIERFKPTDGTTNPSLVYAASKLPAYASIVEDAMAYARRRATDPRAQAQIAIDKMTVNFGATALRSLRSHFYRSRREAVLRHPRIHQESIRID